jgi:succinate dehydrogenase (ubiquinone) cytochrome b560 subunit
MLSGTMYIFGISYLAAPLLGWHLESASLVASFAALPLVIQVLLKAGFALPFTFHSLNGLRHLTWDTGTAFTNKQVIVTGWTVIGVSVAAALGLTFM